MQLRHLRRRSEAEGAKVVPSRRDGGGHSTDHAEGVGDELASAAARVGVRRREEEDTKGEEVEDGEDSRLNERRDA